VLFLPGLQITEFVQVRFFLFYFIQGGGHGPILRQGKKFSIGKVPYGFTRFKGGSVLKRPGSWGFWDPKRNPGDCSPL
jgi:hypothetical protein